MNKADRIARDKLVAYAKKFLRVATRPDEPVDLTLEQVAEFAAQFREGCRQDLIRLLQNLIADDLHDSGTDALRALAGTLSEGESIELWGLPDCICGKSECVYCGRGFNIKPTS